MSFKDIFSLPKLISERFNFEEFTDVNIAIGEKFSFSDTQRERFLEIENDILTKKEDPANLITLLQSKLVIDQKTAEKIAVELWGGYFLLFQDFLPRVDELIVKYGGDILGFQARAKKLLSPRRQLLTFVREFLFDSPLEKVTDECAGDIIEALLDRVMTPDSLQRLVDRVHTAVMKENFPLEAGDHLVDNFEGMIATGTLTPQWAKYYQDLPNNVVNAIPGNFEEAEHAMADDRDQEERQRPSFLFLMQQFEQLPDDVRKRLTSPSAIALREELEKKYGIQLEEFIVRAAIKDFPLGDMALMIKKEFGFSPEQAGDLASEIRKAFFDVTSSEVVVPARERESSQQESAVQKMDPRFHGDDKGCAGDKKTEGVSTAVVVQGPSIALAMPKTPSLTPDEYSQVADTVIAENGVVLSDPALGVRLRQIVMTRLKNIRSMIETKEKLIASTALGGAGLSNDVAESLVRAATMIADQITKGAYVVPKVEVVVSNDKEVEEGTVKMREPSPQPIANKPSPVATPTLAIEEIDGLPMLVERRGSYKPPPVPTPISAPLPPFHPQSTYRITSTPPPVSMQGAKTIPIVVRTGSSDQQRPKAVDIKSSNKLVDGVEEMRIMTLKDFRRLSQDPAEAIKRINQKVQLIEKESMTKKMAAIDAWRENEISALYRDMASESMSAGGSMQAVIAKRTSEGKDALTEEEFDALLDLNELLRT